MSAIQKEKEELIEMFGVHFETIYNIPPLAARILGTLIIDCKEGITFEGLVERMGASKSSVSTNVNLLLKMGKIQYYTLPGDRKKYFKPSPFSERLESYLKMVEYEKKLVEKVLIYREKTAACQIERFELMHTQAYKEHILEIEKLLEKTINKFRRIEENIKPL